MPFMLAADARQYLCILLGAAPPRCCLCMVPLTTFANLSHALLLTIAAAAPIGWWLLRALGPQLPCRPPVHLS